MPQSEVKMKAENHEAIGSPGFGVIARRWGNLHLRSHHSTVADARSAQSRVIDIHPLNVMPITIDLAANGNVRRWNSMDVRELSNA